MGIERISWWLLLFLFFLTGCRGVEAGEQDELAVLQALAANSETRVGKVAAIDLLVRLGSLTVEEGTAEKRRVLQVEEGTTRPEAAIAQQRQDTTFVCVPEEKLSALVAAAVDERIGDRLPQARRRRRRAQSSGTAASAAAGSSSVWLKASGAAVVFGPDMDVNLRRDNDGALATDNALHVAGGVRVGAAPDDACAGAGAAGTLRWDAGGEVLELCDGSAWGPIYEAPPTHAPTVACADDSNLVGLWHMDSTTPSESTLTDSSGRGNHLSRADNGQSVADRDTQAGFGRAVGNWNFVGNVGGDHDPYFQKYNINGGPDNKGWTFDYWLWIGASVSGDPNPFGLGDSGDGYFRIGGGSATVYKHIEYQHSCMSNGPVKAPVAKEVWTHVAVSWDESNLRIFVNGVHPESYHTRACTSGMKISHVRVGGHNPGNSNLNAASVDEARLRTGAVWTEDFDAPTVPCT